MKTRNTLFSIIIFAAFNLSAQVTDIDGNIYKTVVIGTQTWMAENLKTTKFNDGNSIPLVQGKLNWENLYSQSMPAYCFYDSIVTNINLYGLLYNWFTIEKGNVCPVNWHVPTKNEWTILYQYWGGYGKGGGHLKMSPITTKIKKTRIVGGYYETKYIPCSNCSYWTDLQRKNTPCSQCKNKGGKTINTGKYIPKKTEIYYEEENNTGWNGDNNSGFCALPGGSYDQNVWNRNKEAGFIFENLGEAGYWWSATGVEEYSANGIYLEEDDYIRIDWFHKNRGVSIRCIKD